MKMVCPHCGLKGTAGAELYEKKVRCPECQKIFRVTEEVVVGFSAAAAGVIEQSLVGDDAADPARIEGAGRAREQAADTRQQAGADAGTCSICGFTLSRTFIRYVDSRPVCLACAG